MPNYRILTGSFVNNLVHIDGVVSGTCSAKVYEQADRSTLREVTVDHTEFANTATTVGEALIAKYVATA